MITFLNFTHLKFCDGLLLTWRGPRGILKFHDDLLPDHVLPVRAQGCVSYDTHFWPREFPDLAVI
jgi:hypothetical protein